jgi:hypothetical protein
MIWTFSSRCDAGIVVGRPSFSFDEYYRLVEWLGKLVVSRGFGTLEQLK